MFQITISTYLVLVLPVLIYGIDLKSKYKHSAYLDPLEKFQLHWTVFRDTKLIKFAVQVNITQGWIGFGISKGLGGQMEDADLLIGWFRGGKGYLEVKSRNYIFILNWQPQAWFTGMRFHLWTTFYPIAHMFSFFCSIKIV